MKALLPVPENGGTLPDSTSTIAPPPQPVPPRPPSDPVRSKYETAKPVDDKPGYVLNPFTGGEVDVRGLPPGSLVRDPKDQDPEHTFRTPTND